MAINGCPVLTVSNRIHLVTLCGYNRMPLLSYSAPRRVLRPNSGVTKRQNQGRRGHLVVFCPQIDPLHLPFKGATHPTQIKDGMYLFFRKHGGKERVRERSQEGLKPHPSCLFTSAESREKIEGERPQ